jgi:nicotinamide-nucleotide amidase
MRIILLSTGEEVLRGEIVDTNAAFAAASLDDHGFVIGRHLVCGDEQGDLVGTTRQALTDGDVIIASGGLGPTGDDRTVDALAEAFNLSVDIDAELLERLQKRFAERHFPFTNNQVRQARLPQGAYALPNQVGTAVGIELRTGDRTIFWLPGPPAEFQPMFTGEVLPRLITLRAARGETKIAGVRVLRVFGRGEGWIEDSLGNLEHEIPNLNVGYRSVMPEVQIKLRGHAPTPAQLEELLNHAEQVARTRLGDIVFSADKTSLPELVISLLKDRNMRLAVAESCTGGLTGKLLTDIPGSSAVFILSAVTYANNMKERLLGVAPEVLLSEGAVSEQCARAMAEGVRRISGADLSISITGIAGPDGGTPDKPVGTVHFALCDSHDTIAFQHVFRGFGRDAVRMMAAFAALDFLRRRLLWISPLAPV